MPAAVDRPSAGDVANAGSRRARVLWWCAVVLTAGNGVVVGAGSVWFQLFGETADRGDYLVSGGGYLTAAVLLGIGLGAIPRLGVSRFAGGVVLVVAISLLLAGLGSLQRAAELPPHNRPSAGVLDGVGGVALLPWAWVLVWMTIRPLFRGRREAL